MDYAINKSGFKWENQIILQQDVVQKHLSENRFSELAFLIKKRFSVTLALNGNEQESVSPMTRFPFNEETITQLVNILQLYVENDEKYATEDFKNLQVETAKALRTYAVTEDTRIHLNNYKFYEIVREIIKKFCTEEQPELHHKFTFQLLLNILTLDKAVKDMHDSIYDQVCQYFIKFTSNSLECYEATALLWNLTRLQKSIADKIVIKRAINLFADMEEPNEYLGFLLTKFATEEYFWMNYDWFTVTERTAILSILKTLWLKKHVRFSNACLECLVNIFSNVSNVIMKLVSSEDADAAFEVAVSIELLSAVSSMEEVLGLFEKKGMKKDLLVNATALLITSHKAGKMPGFNKFTPVVKLGQFRNPSEDLKRNPAFGFKADLVRLIGNVCYKNKTMQDLAREAEAIPVLLDCCNMDAKNPFIIQWVTFAIRNICEDNFENQKIIAGLQRQGAVSSELLDEIGLTIHAESDRVLKVLHTNN